MKKLVIGGVVSLGLLLVVFAGLSMIKPDMRPAPEVTYDASIDYKARGEYLANNVLGCIECHSDRDWTKYGGPTTGKPGKGGTCYTEDHGIPGYVCASNITADRESGIGMWTDGEVARAIREGVNDRGKPLFPLMPWEAYRELSDVDTAAVVKYIRSLDAVENFVPRHFMKFPINIFLRLQPKPLTEPVPEPSVKTGVEYGQYLVKVAGCRYCHTPVDAQHAMIEDQMYAGGQRFIGPWGDVVAPNLTPHETGIKNFTREGFIQLFKTFAQEGMDKLPADEGSNTVMPWITYSGMTEEDLGSIYDYLMTLPPVDSEAALSLMTTKKLEQAADSPPSTEPDIPLEEVEEDPIEEEESLDDGDDSTD